MGVFWHKMHFSDVCFPDKKGETPNVERMARFIFDSTSTSSASESLSNMLSGWTTTGSTSSEGTSSWGFNKDMTNLIDTNLDSALIKRVRNKRLSSIDLRIALHTYSMVIGFKTKTVAHGVVFKASGRLLSTLLKHFGLLHTYVKTLQLYVHVRCTSALYTVGRKITDSTVRFNN